jgi:hypothetical protein
MTRHRDWRLVWPVIVFTSWSTVAQQSPYIVLEVPDTFWRASLYPFGGYAIAGRKPAAFSDLYAFSIDKVDGPQNGSVRVTGALMKQAEDGGSHIFRFAEISIEPRRLTFRTEVIGNTHYAFHGVFKRTGDLRRFYQSITPVLQGTLAKYENDKQVATARVAFAFKVWKGEPYFDPRKHDRSTAGR